MTTSLIQACMAFTGPQEGCTLFPYRDSAVAGNATVGYGHLLYGAAYAAQVFGVPLTTLQPQWDDLMTAAVGKTASFYETLTDLRLPQAKADDLFCSDLECHIDKCTGLVPGFAELPQPIQTALVDISFNVGTVAKFPNMLAAIARKDWPAVAVESDRPQLPNRSKATRDLILSVSTSTQ